MFINFTAVVYLHGDAANRILVVDGLGPLPEKRIVPISAWGEYCVINNTIQTNISEISIVSAKFGSIKNEPTTLINLPTFGKSISGDVLPPAPYPNNIQAPSRGNARSEFDPTDKFLDPNWAINEISSRVVGSSRLEYTRKLTTQLLSQYSHISAGEDPGKLATNCDLYYFIALELLREIPLSILTQPKIAQILEFISKIPQDSVQLEPSPDKVKNALAAFTAASSYGAVEGAYWELRDLLSDLTEESKKATAPLCDESVVPAQPAFNLANLIDKKNTYQPFQHTYKGPTDVVIPPRGPSEPGTSFQPGFRPTIDTDEEVGVNIEFTDLPGGSSSTEQVAV